MEMVQTKVETRSSIESSDTAERRSIKSQLSKDQNLESFCYTTQVIKAIILALILLAMFALLVTLDPDLEDERVAVVTPAVKWIIHRLTSL
jgi:fumarate reductase subunit D